MLKREIRAAVKLAEEHKDKLIVTVEIKPDRFYEAVLENNWRFFGSIHQSKILEVRPKSYREKK